LFGKYSLLKPFLIPPGEHGVDAVLLEATADGGYQKRLKL